MEKVLKDKVSFFVKRPQKGRRSYAVIKRTKKPNGKIDHETLKFDAIESINRLLQKGIQDLAACEKQIREIVKGLYGDEKRVHAGVVHHADNLRVLDEYWKSEYSHRDLVDRRTIYNDLRRAVEALGNHSIVSASREEIQKGISTRCAGNAQRRVASKINQLLKFIGRSDVRLRKEKKVYRDVRYLTEIEFERIIPHLAGEPLRLLHRVAFYTGMRVGEIFALKAISPNGKAANVVGQIDKSGLRRRTKNGLNRPAYIIPAGRAAVRKWLELDSKVKESLRNLRHSEITRAACRKAFPLQPEKWCVFHDLRHSYAVHLLSLGTSLSLVAQSLGNNISVCQEHYAGFALTNDSIEAIDSMLTHSSGV